MSDQVEGRVTVDVEPIAYGAIWQVRMQSKNGGVVFGPIRTKDQALRFREGLINLMVEVGIARTDSTVPQRCADCERPLFGDNCCSCNLASPR